MDKKAREIIGLPVVTFNTGRKIADVEDMILDPARPQVLALVVQEKSLFHSARVIPFGYISAIGPDAVVIPDGKAVVDLNRLKDKQLRALDNEQVVRGLRVLTDDGRRLGTVADMLIDTNTGEIKGYYMSIGRVLDVTQGTRYLPATGVVNMGQRVLYVSPQTADEMEAQVGGWSGALDQAGGKLRTAGSKANEGLTTFGDRMKSTGGRWNEQLGRYGEQVRTDVPARATGMVVGKTAHRRVTAPDGTVIAKEGDIITQDQADAAKDAGRLPQLIMAVGAGPAREHADSFSSQASDSWEQTRNEFRDLWSRITGGYSQSVDTADDKIMTQRIKNALGRPVNRVILDADDNIILNTGDIITNRAVEEARAAGVLDILVASVYTDKPQLSLEDLKAPRSGEAALENITPTGAGSGTRARASRSSSKSASNTDHVPTTEIGNAQTGGTTFVPPTAD